MQAAAKAAEQRRVSGDGRGEAASAAMAILGAAKDWSPTRQQDTHYVGTTAMGEWAAELSTAANVLPRHSDEPESVLSSSWSKAGPPLSSVHRDLFDVVSPSVRTPMKPVASYAKMTNPESTPEVPNWPADFWPASPSSPRLTGDDDPGAEDLGAEERGAAVMLAPSAASPTPVTPNEAARRAAVNWMLFT